MHNFSVVFTTVLDKNLYTLFTHEKSTKQFLERFLKDYLKLGNQSQQA